MTSQKPEEKKPEEKTKTYLEAISLYSPWASRSASPRPVEKPIKEEKEAKVFDQASSQRGGDHKLSKRKPLSLKYYPRDCPKLDVQWFHAVDVAKRKPDYVFTNGKDADKPPPVPKKWNTFSQKDSQAIEAAFQGLPTEEEDTAGKTVHEPIDLTGDGRGDEMPRSDNIPNRSIGTANKDDQASTRVPVNEDYLFDVDVERRELGPAYWLGPIYECRRGSWFYAEGTMRPCDENLATQLEEGYLKAAPWRSAEQLQRSKSQGRSGTERVPRSTTPAPKSHASSRSVDASEAILDESLARAEQKPPSSPLVSSSPSAHRLFGPHSNSFVTYQGPTTAWILSDDFISRMSSTMFSRFAGGAGTKVVRGYIDNSKKQVAKDGKSSQSRPTSPVLGAADSPKRHSMPVTPASGDNEELTSGEERASEQETRLQALERQMSNLVTSTISDPAKEEEAERQREEDEIRDDYRDAPNDPQDREIEHLVLVTHGIGQRLGARFETFNFIHDVNELRKTLKAVYGASQDLQALNDEVDKLPQNCRIQVLPVCWRHLLDFPKHSLKHNRKEYDLGDASAEDDDKYPSLQDITVEGVPALRNIVADLALDILLYQTPAYKEHIARIVAEEANRIHSQFIQRNPYFQGKVSMIGHSLGSAIMFDILCDQDKEQQQMSRFEASHQPPTLRGVKLDFDVQNMFCLGSPIGLFSMLTGKTIAARRGVNNLSLAPESIEQESSRSAFTSAPAAHLDFLVSAPKVQSLYNIFHPSDPIAYRIEPLISGAMTSMKPQNLPYVKKSWLNAAPGAGLSAIPNRLGQSVSGLWSSVSSGLTDRFIHRSLGLTAENALRLGMPAPQPGAQGPHSSSGAGEGLVASDNAGHDPKTEGLKRKLTEDTAAALADGQHPPTLIESELDTLYLGFRKRQKSEESSTEDPQVEEKARTMKREEAKVRALNSNGRVDYSIQEGAFDITFLAGIASHLAYWQDEDIGHFLTSQLLSKQSNLKRRQSKRTAADHSTETEA